MDHLSKFSVDFAGLEPGNYAFDFQVDDEFFAAFEESAIRTGRVHVRVGLLRKEEMLVFEMDIEGAVDLTCDRCLGEFRFPVVLHKELIVKMKDRPEESEEEDVVIISREDHRFPLAGHLYDYLSLAVPYRKLHPDEAGKSTCDPAALREIEHRAGKGPKPDDGRWDALKGLDLSGR